VQWVWDKGLPYLPPQERLIDDITNDPLAMPSAFEEFLGRAALYLSTAAAKQQYEVMVQLVKVVT